MLPKNKFENFNYCPSLRGQNFSFFFGKIEKKPLKNELTYSQLSFSSLNKFVKWPQVNQYKNCSLLGSLADWHTKVHLFAKKKINFGTTNFFLVWIFCLLYFPSRILIKAASISYMKLKSSLRKERGYSTLILIYRLFFF